MITSCCKQAVKLRTRGQRRMTKKGHTHGDRKRIKFAGRPFPQVRHTRAYANLNLRMTMPENCAMALRSAQFCTVARPWHVLAFLGHAPRLHVADAIWLCVFSSGKARSSV